MDGLTIQELKRITAMRINHEPNLRSSNSNMNGNMSVNDSRGRSGGDGRLPVDAAPFIPQSQVNHMGNNRNNNDYHSPRYTNHDRYNNKNDYNEYNDHSYNTNSNRGNSNMNGMNINSYVSMPMRETPSLSHHHHHQQQHHHNNHHRGNNNINPNHNHNTGVSAIAMNNNPNASNNNNGNNGMINNTSLPSQGLSVEELKELTRQRLHHAQSSLSPHTQHSPHTHGHGSHSGGGGGYHNDSYGGNNHGNNHHHDHYNHRHYENNNHHHHNNNNYNNNSNRYNNNNHYNNSNQYSMNSHESQYDNSNSSRYTSERNGERGGVYGSSGGGGRNNDHHPAHIHNHNQNNNRDHRHVNLQANEYHSSGPYNTNTNRPLSTPQLYVDSYDGSGGMSGSGGIGSGSGNGGGDRNSNRRRSVDMGSSLNSFVNGMSGITGGGGRGVSVIESASGDGTFDIVLGGSSASASASAIGGSDAVKDELVKQNNLGGLFGSNFGDTFNTANDGSGGNGNGNNDSGGGSGNGGWSIPDSPKGYRYSPQYRKRSSSTGSNTSGGGGDVGDLSLCVNMAEAVLDNSAHGNSPRTNELSLH